MSRNTTVTWISRACQLQDRLRYIPQDFVQTRICSTIFHVHYVFQDIFMLWCVFQTNSNIYHRYNFVNITDTRLKLQSSKTRVSTEMWVYFTQNKTKFLENHRDVCVYFTQTRMYPLKTTNPPKCCLLGISS